MQPVWQAQENADRLNLNPGIRRVVALLNKAGWTTIDSGDGETHEFGCDREVGYVVIKLDRDAPGFDLEVATTDVYEFLRAHGVTFGSGEDDVLIQGSYSPVDGLALVDIHGIHDRMLGYCER